MEAAAMDAVVRFPVVMLQVHVGAGKLDEGFVIKILCPLRPQPDVLEDIVSLVIRLPVEELEIFQVAGVPRRAAFPSGHPRRNPFVFTHGVEESRNHRGRRADRAKNVAEWLGGGFGAAMMKTL